MRFLLAHSTWEYKKEVYNPFTYGAVTVFGWPFQIILLKLLPSPRILGNPRLYIPRPHDHNAPRLLHDHGLDCFLFARHYWGNRYFLSLPEGTKMFQFSSSCPHTLLIQVWVIEFTFYGVAPFGHLRVKACLQLTEAYRSLPRPSSPSSAKSSTICP